MNNSWFSPFDLFDLAQTPKACAFKETENDTCSINKPFYNNTKTLVDFLLCVIPEVVLNNAEWSTHGYNTRIQKVWLCCHLDKGTTTRSPDHHFFKDMV